MNRLLKARLAVKVVPGATHPGIVGWLGDTLKVRVSEPPEKGKANAAVKALISTALDLPGSAVQIVSGETAARKGVEISGMSQLELERRLNRSAPK